MTVTIRPEHERLIAEAIESGAYAGPDEVIARALEVLRGDDEWLAANKAAITGKLERAIAQLDRGEGVSDGELRTRLDERKLSWRASQPPS